MILFLSFVQMARTQKNKATAHHLGLLKVYISFSLSWCCCKQFLNIVLIMSVEGTFIWLQIELTSFIIGIFLRCVGYLSVVEHWPQYFFSHLVFQIKFSVTAYGD
jgi:hypothetical protein